MSNQAYPPMPSILCFRQQLRIPIHLTPGSHLRPKTVRLSLQVHGLIGQLGHLLPALRQVLSLTGELWVWIKEGHQYHVEYLMAIW